MMALWPCASNGRHFRMQVVLQRSSLRSGAEEDSREEEEVFTIQLVQLVSVVVLLMAV